MSATTEPADEEPTSDATPAVSEDAPADAAPGVGTVELDVLEEDQPEAGNNSLGRLDDVDIELTVRVGVAEISLKRLRTLGRGSLVVLDRRAGSPVDILANGTLVAQGELVTVEECFGVRVSNLVVQKPSALGE